MVDNVPSQAGLYLGWRKSADIMGEQQETARFDAC